MLAYVIVAALASQAASVQYQRLAFETSVDENDVQTGQLSPEQLVCVQSHLPVLFPGENEADVLAMTYARQDSNRDNACVTFFVERQMSASAFVLLENEPDGARASDDGLTFFWREKLPTQCLDRDANFAGLNACVASFGGPPGLFTEWAVSRQSTADPMVLQYLWEVITRTPGQYGLDRSSRARIRSHAREFLRPEVGQEP